MKHITRSKSLLYVMCFVFYILIDQVTKWFFSARDFFVGPVHFGLVKNYGLPFGLNFGELVNLSIIGAALAGFVYLYWQHRKTLFSESTFALVMAGTLSNIIDRLYLDYVRDFIDIGWGFTFNLADVFIVIGLLLILLMPSNTESLG